MSAKDESTMVVVTCESHGQSVVDDGEGCISCAREANTWEGNYGFSIEFCDGDASSASHQGQCDEDVDALFRVPYMKAQFEKIDPENIRRELKEYGAWDETELADDAQNRARILWLAAGELNDRKVMA